MRKWKKHLAIPALAAAIALPAAFAANTYALRDNGTFALKDLAGSRSALDGVAMTGELRDGYHMTRFRLEGGELKTNTELFRQMQDTFWLSFQNGGGNARRVGDLQVSAFATGSSYDIRTQRWEKNGSMLSADREAIVSPSIHAVDSTAGYTNYLDYGVAGVGDRLFFTVPVTFGYTGRSGIYELNLFSWGLPEKWRSQYPSRKIAEIDLDANKDNGQPKVAVLGMEAVGSKLAVILAQGDDLIVRSFDSDSGEQLGEAAVPDFRLDDYDARYAAVSDTESGILNLGFESLKTRKELILSFDLSGGVRIANAVRADYSEDGTDDKLNDIHYLRYVNGKLYVMKTAHVAKTGDYNRESYDVSLPTRCLIYVYEQSRLAYKGELITDMNQDKIGMIISSEMNGSYRYEPKEYRRFMNFKIESTTGEKRS